jgi:hypothetical protein
MSTKGTILIVDDTPADLELLRQANAQLQCELAGRKQAELEIQRQAAFPRFNPNPVLELSAAGEIAYLNEAAGEMARALGLENPAQMLPPNTLAMVRECLATGRPKLRVETQIGPHPGHASGVRPSPGAATSASGGVSELSSILGEAGAAAPEDGRTPAQSPSFPPPSCVPPIGRRAIVNLAFMVRGVKTRPLLNDGSRARDKRAGAGAAFSSTTCFFTSIRCGVLLRWVPICTTRWCKAPRRSGLASAACSTSPSWGCYHRRLTDGATLPSFTLPATACRRPARPSEFAPASTLTAG